MIQDNPIAVGIDFLGPLDSVHQQSFLLRVEDGRYLKVSRSTYALLQLMDGTRNLAEIANCCREDWNLEIEEAHILEIVKEKFIPNRLIRNAAARRRFPKGFRPSREHFILVKFTLLPVPWVQRMARILLGLFHPKMMLALGAISLVAHLFFYATLSPGRMFADFRSYQYWFMPILLFLISILHELGHAAGCQYYGARPGPIGIGLYIVFPVFWTDLKSAWQLKRTQRAIVDIGGLYVEGVLNIVLILIAFIYPSPWISLLVIWSNLSTLYNLIPFLRLDGYWLVSDLLGIPNLDQESRDARRSIVWKRKLPKIDNYLHGIGRAAFYLYVVFGITIMPFIFYRVWLFLIRISSDLPQKILILQRFLEGNSSTSLWDAVTVVFQVLIMVSMLMAWTVSFLVPIVERAVALINYQWREKKQSAVELSHMNDTRIKNE